MGEGTLPFPTTQES